MGTQSSPGPQEAPTSCGHTHTPRLLCFCSLTLPHCEACQPPDRLSGQRSEQAERPVLGETGQHGVVNTRSPERGVRTGPISRGQPDPTFPSHGPHWPAASLGWPRGCRCPTLALGVFLCERGGWREVCRSPASVHLIACPRSPRRLTSTPDEISGQPPISSFSGQTLPTAFTLHSSYAHQNQPSPFSSHHFPPSPQFLHRSAAYVLTSRFPSSEPQTSIATPS